MQLLVSLITMFLLHNSMTNKICDLSGFRILSALPKISGTIPSQIFLPMLTGLYFYAGCTVFLCWLHCISMLTALYFYDGCSVSMLAALHVYAYCTPWMYLFLCILFIEFYLFIYTYLLIFLFTYLSIDFIYSIIFIAGISIATRCYRELFQVKSGSFSISHTCKTYQYSTTLA
jgi:hypothetical protein